MFGRSTVPAPANLAAARKKQIDSLHSHVPAVKAADANKSVFDVPVLLRNGSQLFLRITLPAGFPQDSPILRVESPSSGVQHAWLNPQQYVVGHDKLRQWNPSHDLGKIVQDVVRELCARAEPPRSSGARLAGASGYLPARLTDADGWQIVPNSGHIPLPQVVIPSSFPELESRTAAELEFLNLDKEEFEKFVNGHECIASVRRVRDDLKRSVVELEGANKKLQEDLDRVFAEKASLEQVQKERSAQLEASAVKQQKILERRSVPVVLAGLAASAEQMDQQCEAFANEYMNGPMDTPTFIKTFRDMKKRHHSRMARKEW
eukprot:CAMPEP_0184648148 /NCGR_PEP_ID=MMETSP0308-20130426/5210_1 /TAXON_ID=38269 /ORGANISM="Gloeochaete witrockiana, Strain SAG 46.84" /LENGTH=318 /DNA_ID=CAMNT_0027079737 /DNA_START=138 /DNA_END=1091 /DNA_ORIENTATION=-